MNDKIGLRSEEFGSTSLSFWYLAILSGFCEHCKNKQNVTEFISNVK